MFAELESLGGAPPKRSRVAAVGRSRSAPPAAPCECPHGSPTSGPAGVVVALSSVALADQAAQYELDVDVDAEAVEEQQDRGLLTRVREKRSEFVGQRPEPDCSCYATCTSLQRASVA